MQPIKSVLPFCSALPIQYTLGDDVAMHAAMLQVEISRLGPNLQNILRQSYDNANVTFDLRRTSNLQNILRREQGYS